MQNRTVWGLSSAAFVLGLLLASAQPTPANPTVPQVAQAALSPAEAVRRKGDKLIEDANKESGDKQKALKKQALTEYRASAEAYAKAGDRVKAPLMMATVAQLSWELEDYAQSLDFYQRLATYVDADRHVFWQVAARHGIAANYQQLEDFDRALAAYHEALDLVRKHPQLSHLPPIAGNVGLSFKHSTKVGMTWQSQIDVLSSHNALEPGNQIRWRLLRLVTLR
jgi:tetratricopeptide (TPR) repeat protein